jgi:Cu(I)/Ag(I) efflux system membrane protein CusA/SilA
MALAGAVDETLRDLAAARLEEFRPDLGRALVSEAFDMLVARLGPAACARKPTDEERAGMIDAMAVIHGDRLAVQVLADDVTQLLKDLLKRLVAEGIVRDGPELLRPAASVFERVIYVAGEVVGVAKGSMFRRITDHVVEEHERRIKARVKLLNWEIFDRAVVVVNWTAISELMKLGRERKWIAREGGDGELVTIRGELDKPFSEGLLLWRKTKADLVEEMNTALQMPGWGNSFTQPIANRIEMLSTGVRQPVAVKVFGSDLEVIQRVSQEIAGVLRGVRGAADVFPDQIIGKGYVEIKIDRKKAARYGINVGDIQDVVEVAMGGRPLTMTVEGRERYPVRVRYARDYRDNIDAIKGILVSARGTGTSGEGRGGMDGMTGSMGSAGAPNASAPVQIPLAALADIRVVEGPSMIKSENGLLRSYIQLRVRERDEVGFVEEARRVVADKVKLPAGMYLEWTGTFEHQVRANKTLQLVFPGVIALIMLILYLTHKSWTDAMLLMTSVLGALAGGAIFQWLFGFHFSVAVQVGYIACFGMAVETGVVMLVYLREAIEERGGLAGIGSIGELRQAILEGAIHRLRPKLLTEGAAILSIAPMLWATDVGSEVTRPMAAPVLGGLLIADEVIDVFLPVLFFAVSKGRWRKVHGSGSEGVS